MPAQDPVLTAAAQPSAFPTKNAVNLDEQKALLAKANEAMYKQNVELAVRNKTLSVLRSLSDITMKATSIAEVTQSIVDIIVRELNLAAAIIALTDTAANALRPVAITRSEDMNKALSLTGKTLDQITIPLDDMENLAVNAIRDKEQKITGNLLDLLVPLVDQETSDQIERITGIKTIIIYPLFLGDKAIGVLDLGLTKSMDDLSRAEKDTLRELIGVVTIAINRAQLLEDIKLTNEQLHNANERLKTLDKLKDEFVSVASHELRTPMTAIRSYTWLVLNKKAESLDPKAKEHLERVYKSTERLIHLVNEMLDVSRIEGGRVELKPENFDITQLSQETIAELTARASERGVSLEVTADGTIPNAYADREKIHQVLENLMGNALKFTPAGGNITVHISQQDQLISVGVTDTGRGIHPEDMERLFKKFNRLDNQFMTMAGSGTGLGLYISKQYVQLSGGTIGVTSEVGKGSTFTFTLPAAKS